ncbi:MAG: tetratricopeptide repeat protein [Bacteroidota bacterium]|nr:tetratricopeptide repeat protein [Bacteroidota bacterium]
MSFKIKFPILIITLLIPLWGTAQSFPKKNTSEQNSLESELTKVTDLEKKIEILTALAQITSDSNSDKCTEYALTGIRYAKKMEQLRYEAPFYMILGNLNYEKYNHKAAIDYYEKALHVYRKTKNRAGIAKTYTNLANIFDNPRKQIEYYQLSLEEFTLLKDTVDMRICYNNLGVSYTSLEKLDSALIFYRKALHLAEQSGDFEGAGYALGNMGEVYVTKEQYHTAKQSFKRSLTNFETGNNIFGQLLGYKNFGLYYYSVEKYSKSLDYLLSTLPEAEKSDFSGLKEEIYDLIVKNYEARKNYKAANKYMHQLQNLRDSVYNIETQHLLQARKVQLDIERKSLQISELKQEKRINRLKLWLALGGMFAAAVIGLILFFDKTETIRKNKIIFKQEKKLAEKTANLAKTNLKNERLEKENLVDKINYKNKELTNFANYIIEKKHFIGELKKQINAIKRKAENEEACKDLQLLLIKINQQMSIDKDRKDFELHAAQLNNDFLLKLENEFSDITKSEKRLITLLMLELSSNQIASILNITTSSVHTKRYRLRKKLNISSDSGITDYFSNL